MPRNSAYSSTDLVFQQLAGMDRVGVAIFTRGVKSLPYDTQIENLEYRGILIQHPISVALFTIYRPPIYPLNRFIGTLMKLLTRVTTEIFSPIVILGDFHDNALSTTSSLQQLFTNNGFQQLVNKPTTESGTCLDLVFVRGFHELPQVTVKPLYYSFHDAIFLECKI